jgi:hypothetical protein
MPQQLVLQHNVDIILEYLIKALNLHTSAVRKDIYRALATVVYCNAGRVSKVSFHLLYISFLLEFPVKLTIRLSGYYSGDAFTNLEIAW